MNSSESPWQRYTRISPFTISAEAAQRMGLADGAGSVLLSKSYPRLIFFARRSDLDQLGATIFWQARCSRPNPHMRFNGYRRKLASEHSTKLRNWDVGCRSNNRGIAAAKQSQIPLVSSRSSGVDSVPPPNWCRCLRWSRDNQPLSRY